MFATEDMTKELEQIYKSANCTNCPSEWFFPTIGKGKPSTKPGSPVYNAFATCADCNVVDLCKEFATKYKCVGIWGGQLFSLHKRRKKKHSNR